jgi:hypothetical protein
MRLHLYRFPCDIKLGEIVSRDGINVAIAGESIDLVQAITDGSRRITNTYGSTTW